MTTTKRTDCHRVGVLAPVDYVYVMSYVIPEQGWANTGYRFDDARQASAAVGYGSVKPMFGNIGKCAICGASFRAGDIWTHVPTGDMLHVGHECADAIGLAVDGCARRALNQALAGIKVARKANKAKATSAERAAKIRAAHCAQHQGLDAVFSSEDARCKAFAKNFDRFGGLPAGDIEAIVAYAARLAK